MTTRSSPWCLRRLVLVPIFNAQNSSFPHSLTRNLGKNRHLLSDWLLPVSPFKPQKRSKTKYDAVFSSRLDEQTGILTYLQAVKFLQKKGFPFRLIVLGDGKYRKKAQRIAESVGFVQDPSLFFKQARFAFVSRYLAILEAFACKKLVFAVYDNPLKEDYLKMSPFAEWIIVEKSSKKLAEKVYYYMRHPERAEKMVEKAYKWAKGQTWNKMVNLYLRLWRMK